MSAEITSQDIPRAQDAPVSAAAPCAELWVCLGPRDPKQANKPTLKGAWDFQPFDDDECERRGIYRFVYSPKA
jgi:hypothetical protein